jgi:hypothetical protein
LLTKHVRAPSVVAETAAVVAAVAAVVEAEAVVVEAENRAGRAGRHDFAAS